MLKKIQTTFLILLLISSGHLFAQNFDTYIQEQTDQLSYDSLYQKLQHFESLGIKEVGTQNLDNTKDWIVNFYQQNGYTDITFDSFNLGQNQVSNIIVTKTGTIYPDTYLIVDGHYDTYNGPGVNDNGTGTAIVLEVARMLKDIETAYSIKFIHFTAEEIGLVGSSHYVENIVLPEEMDIRLVFNIDEVGGVAGETNNTITCERDEWSPTSNNEASAAFTDTLASLTEMYSDLFTQISYAYGSDYVPFMENGYVVTGLYETNESPFPHSVNDSLSKLDPEYVFEVAKASLASTLYFSNYINTNTVITQNPLVSIDFNISPNPFKNYFEFENKLSDLVVIRIFDITGIEIFKSSVDKNSTKRLYPVCDPGMYLYKVSLPNGPVIYTDKLIKR